MVIAGGAQFWNKQQKLAAARDSDRLAKEEVNSLTALIRKSQNFRSSYELLMASDRPCQNNCPKLRIIRKKSDQLCAEQY